MRPECPARPLSGQTSSGSCEARRLTRPRRALGKGQKASGMDFVLAQKFFQLVGIEVGQHLVPGDKRGNVSLVGKFLHLFVGLAIFADIDLDKGISTLAKVLLCVNAPGAPFAT